MKHSAAGPADPANSAQSRPSCRPAGWGKLVMGAHESVLSRRLKGLILRGPRKRTYTAFFDDALIVADELGIPIEPGSLEFGLPVCEVPESEKQALIALSVGGQPVLLIQTRSRTYCTEVYQDGALHQIHQESREDRSHAAGGKMVNTSVTRRFSVAASR